MEPWTLAAILIILLMLGLFVDKWLFSEARSTQNLLIIISLVVFGSFGAPCMQHHSYTR